MTRLAFVDNLSHCRTSQFLDRYTNTMESLRVTSANMLADLYVQTFNEENEYYRSREFSNKSLKCWPPSDTYDPEFRYHTRIDSPLQYQSRMRQLATVVCPRGRHPHILALQECQVAEAPGAPGDQFGCLLDNLETYCSTLRHTGLCRYSTDQAIFTGLMIVYDSARVTLLSQESLTFVHHPDPGEFSTLRATFCINSNPDVVFHVFCHHNNPKSEGGRTQWLNFTAHLSTVREPYLIMGDFNRDSRLTGKDGRHRYIQDQIESLGLTDPWLDNILNTYAPLRGDPGRIDYILLSSQFTVHDRTTFAPQSFFQQKGWRARNALIRYCGSDHAPVKVTCSLPPVPEAETEQEGTAESTV